ncbi:glycosyltransferase family 61 protein [Gonapodya prolifera JEL478]|uniref:Glycosyltransferase family 61 protein n=1 Tax=Gonapodya prolifera (strain JEL478) TaxID=1344416 RepID=A0A139ALI1_GONPJ|nr:glycosyltransferase family 61 protein [Gonapodya prolifera JEL478]|eukprot:KXS17646.1 glycosyltransferase family 61 protein [Gonapodya prolifera JEL478]
MYMFGGLVMHVLHDDVIGIYHTLKRFAPASTDPTEPFSRDIHLLFLDSWPSETPYADIWQKFFTYHLPWTASEHLRGGEHDITLFTNAVVGISKEGTWYQYGFLLPQGPIAAAMENKQGEAVNPGLLLDVDESERSQIVYDLPGWVHENVGWRVQEVAAWIREESQRIMSLEAQIDGYDHYADPGAVLISRRRNRLILNEAELSNAIAVMLELETVVVDLDNMPFETTVYLLGRAEVLIGMHGAALVTGMFARPCALLIELFPYGIDSNLITPYRTLAELEGINLIYRAWENQHHNMTVGHPERPQELGGIAHLPKEDQYRVIGEPVKEHLCCKDPSWLYHIYQDTWVSVHEILQILADAREEQKRCNVPLARFHFNPSAPPHLTCRYPVEIADLGETDVRILWSPPYNVPKEELSRIDYLLTLNVRPNGTVGTFHLRGICQLDVHVPTWGVETQGRERLGWDRLIISVTAICQNRTSRSSQVECEL